MSGKAQRRIRTVVFCDRVQATILARAHLAPAGIGDVTEVYGLNGAMEVLERAQTAGQPAQALFLDWAPETGRGLFAWMRATLAPPPVVVLLGADGAAAQADAQEAAQGMPLLFAKTPLAATSMRQTLAQLEASLRQPLPAQRATRPGPRHGMRVLVAEDQKNIRHLIASMCLHDLGYRDVVACEDGRAAWAELERAAAERRPFELVISDWTMPEMDGLQLFERLRATPATAATAFIMLTAHTQQEDVVKAISAGVRHYITKPFSLETLESKIAEALRAAAPEPKAS